MLNMFKRFFSIITIIVLSVSMMTILPGVTGNSVAATEKTVDTTGNSVRIYGIYMKRASGKANPSDAYGDAVLIESDGKYLLMDTGASRPVKDSMKIYESNLVDTLKKMGVEELDVYLSHLHKDHRGGLKPVCQNFKVNNLYLPDLNLCKDYHTPNTDKTINALYYEQVDKALQGINGRNTRIINLVPDVPGKNTHYDYSSDLDKPELQRLSEAMNFAIENAESASTVNVGNVKGKVIGPVGTYTMKQFASQDGAAGSQEGHYLNNTSLVTMFDLGKMKYFTGGDIEKIEEGKLAARYGKSLSADIMKVSHHGISTSSSDTILSKVSPTWSFNCNNGYGSKNTGRNGHSKYGYYYGVENGKHTIIFQVNDNRVRIYKDTNDNGIPDERPVTGWVSSNGRYQYYSGSGYLQKGWAQLGSSKYYLGGKSGFRYTGKHKISGVNCSFSSSGVLTKPGKPSKVKIRSMKSTKKKVKIKWRKASGAGKYEVYRATSSKGQYMKVATLKGSARSYTNTKPVYGKRYYYKVRGTKSTAGTTIYGSFSAAKRSK